MAEVPRRLPLTPEERLKIVATSVTPSAAARGTRFARPVNSSLSLPRGAEPTGVGSVVVLYVGRYVGVATLNWTGPVIAPMAQEWAEWGEVYTQGIGDLDLAPLLTAPPTSVYTPSGSGFSNRVFKFSGEKKLWLLNLRGHLRYNVNIVAPVAETRALVAAADQSIDIYVSESNVVPDTLDNRITRVEEHSCGVSYHDTVSSYVTWRPNIHGMPLLLGDDSYLHVEAHSTIPKTTADFEMTLMCIGSVGEGVTVTDSIDFDTFSYRISGGIS